MPGVRYDLKVLSFETAVGVAVAVGVAAIVVVEAVAAVVLVQVVMRPTF